MLSNAYFLAKFRFDTAENEPAKNLQNFAEFANFADPNPPNPVRDHVGALLGRLRMPLRDGAAHLPAHGVDRLRPLRVAPALVIVT